MNEGALEKWTTVDLNTVTSFHQLPLSDKTQRALKECNYFTPTEVQRKCMRPILRGLDVIAQAQTGSGKTLAYTLPILELLENWHIRSKDGPVVLVVVPTRDLAHQTLRMIHMVGRQHPITMLHVVGDKSKSGQEMEWKSIGNANIVVSTPGRLIQHIEQNPHCCLDRVQIVVLDETDRLLDANFEDQLTLVMNSIPKQRQLLIFSATQVDNVSKLLGLHMQKAVQVQVHTDAGITPPNLQQFYSIVVPQFKVATLWSFLMSHTKRRVLVFVACQKQVRFLYELFRRMRLPMRIFELRGNMILSKRNRALEEFAEACAKVSDYGNQKRAMGSVMLGTSVMERGLDFPCVDWVVQFDCPHSKSEYIHRAGRTARLDNIGHSLIFIMPTELKYLRKIINAYKMDIKKLKVVKKTLHQQKIHLQLLETSNLRELSQMALLGFLNDYLDHGDRRPLTKSIPYSILTELAQGYGLAAVVPPLSEKLQAAYGVQERAKTGENYRLNQLVDSDDEDKEEDAEVQSPSKTEVDSHMEAEPSSSNEVHSTLVEKIGTLLTELSTPLKSMYLGKEGKLSIPGENLNINNLMHTFPQVQLPGLIRGKKVETSRGDDNDQEESDMEGCEELDTESQCDTSIPINTEERDKLDKCIRSIIMSAHRYRGYSYSDK